MNQILYSSKRNKKLILITTIILSLFIIAVVVSFSFALANIGNEKIYENVSIQGIDVSGLTKNEAIAKINNLLDGASNHKITLEYDSYSKTYEAGEIRLSIENLSSIVEDAYKYGRGENIIGNNYTILLSSYNKKEIPANIKIDENDFKKVVTDINSGVSDMTKNDYTTISDTVISVFKGHDGVKLDEEKLNTELIENMMAKNESMLISLEASKASRIDFDKLYEEIYVEPVNAQYNENDGFEVTPDSEGKSFNVNDVKAVYKIAPDNTTFNIEIVFTKPEITVDDLSNTLFADVLATYETKYDRTYLARVNNMQIAADKINGTILYPNEEFSYNNIVGPRTVANGFKKAHVYAGGRVVDGLGGGICQISTTIYNSVLLSNLNVVERKNHMMHTGYQPAGRDATVVYGNIDFRFTNTRKTPIKIETVLNKGIVKCTIYGKKEVDEPSVELESVILETIPYTTISENDNTMEIGTTKVVQYPVNGYVTETYKILKDASGNQISRTLVSKDKYLQTSKIIKVGTKPAPVPVTPAPEPEQGTVITPPQIENENTSMPNGWDSPESPYSN